MQKELYFSPTTILHEPQENSVGMLTGYVTKFNQLSADRGGFKAKFLPGAFSNLDKEGYSVFALLNHSDDPLDKLGRTENGTLKLSQDDVGLKFSLDLPNTTTGRDVATLVQRKDLQGMSFGYVPDQYEWKGTKDQPILEHSQGELLEISVVYDPAFQNTSVELHCMEETNDRFRKELEAMKAQPALFHALTKMKMLKMKIKALRA